MKVNMFFRFFAFICTIICFQIPVLAVKKNCKKNIAPSFNPMASSIVVDAKTGEILHFDKADQLIYPASLTKLMTLYLTFEAIKNGELSPNQYVPVSYKAAQMPASKLGLRVGEMVKVKDLIMGLIIKSANDAAVVLAETVSGNEKLFAKKMTMRAKQLGMYNTRFKNASGWHNHRQKTNAMDLAKLSIALNRDFPQYWSLFSQTSFNFKGRIIHSHNHITRQYEGAEGLKTGYTRPSGFNLITSAMNKGRRLIGVVTGGSSAKERDLKMVSLLNRHFGVKTQLLTSTYMKKKPTFKKPSRNRKKIRTSKSRRTTA